MIGGMVERTESVRGQLAVHVGEMVGVPGVMG